MTDSMIDRVARASFAYWRQRMIETDQRPEVAGALFEDLSDSEREFAYAHARAVIQAMRDPTPEMAQAASQVFPTHGGTMCEDCFIEYWQSAIDEALK